MATSPVNQSSFRAAADAAESEMPGWKAASLATNPNLSRIENAMPGRTLDQLKAKFLGTRVRSAMVDSDKVVQSAEPAHMVKMVRNKSGTGPDERLVVVSGKKIIAVQG